MSDKLIFAEIMFDIVYPSPECVLVVNGDKMATNVTVSDEILTRLFYKLKLRLVCEILKSECIDSIAISCTVGGEDVHFDDHKNMSYCPDVTTSFNSTEESESLWKTVLQITFICFATFCIAVVTCVVRWRKRRKRKQNYISLEGGVVHSTNYVNSRSRRLRSQCNMTEEFELSPLIQELNQEQVHSGTNTEETNKSLQEQEIRNGTTCTDRIRAYTKQMLRELLKKFNLVIEELKSHLEKSLYAAWYVKTCENTNSAIYSTRLKDTKRTNRYTTPPAQKMKDVTRILHHAILHDTVYIQRLTTDTGINLARHLSLFDGFNFYTCSSELATKHGQSHKAWVTCPAQKDVIKIVHYARLYDKTYIQRLVTNTRINCARLQKSFQREVPSYSESDPQRPNSQTMDDGYHHAILQNADNQIKLDMCRSTINGMNCSIDPTCVTCPAPNDKDVNKLINYAKRHDKIYMQILVTNERINYVRQLCSK